MGTESTKTKSPDLGDIVIVLLAGTLSGLHQRLIADGFPRAAKFVEELTDRCDEYVEETDRQSDEVNGQ